MLSFGILARLLFVLLMVGLVLIIYLVWARPRQLKWGATDEELKRRMPGDDLDPTPTFLATRAITIAGAPAEIWPWLLQMGYGRAGYYGYDIMENLGSPSGLHSTNLIVPKWQRFQIGDKVPISPASELVFYAIKPDQYLIWAGQSGQNPGGFTWELYPVNDHQTRLVSRIRWSHHAITKPWLFSLDMLTEFTDHLAVRKILQGIKGRVEGHNETFLASTTEFIIYLTSLFIFIASLVLILSMPFTPIRCLAGLVAGIGWLFVWYGSIPAWGGLIWDILMVFALYQAFF